MTEAPRRAYELDVRERRRTPLERTIDASASRPRQELSAYQQTMRDRIAAALIGDNQSLARRNFVGGLFGSVGIGTTGTGLVDLTPAGVPLALEEAWRNRDPQAAAMALMPPGARHGAQAVRAGARAAIPHFPTIGPDDATRASRSVPIYDPPPQPPRPFSADYPPERFPNGVPHDGSGRLTHDLDNRPLHARWVVGRRTAGGADEAFPTAELDPFATAVTGHPPQSVAESALLPQTMGLYSAVRGSGRPEGRINLYSGLTEPWWARVLSHEIGHGVKHQIVGNAYLDGASISIPDRLQGQFRRIYNDQNNPDRARTGIDAWRGPNKPRPEHVVSPETRGYRPEQVDSELWSEGVRAYLTDPNYIKTLAPDAAAFIRELVNNHPTLSKTIQFNSMALPLGAPFAIGPRDQADAAQEPGFL
jgi:hypothetical protein